MTICPACHREAQDGTQACPFCGVVYAKWKSRSQSSPSGSIPPQQTPQEMERVNPIPVGTITRLLVGLVLGLILFVGYQQWNRRQVDRPSPPQTAVPVPPVETQPSQPTQPLITFSHPPDRQLSSIQTSQASVDDHKLDGQGEKQNRIRYEIPFEAYEGAAKRIIIAVTFNDSVTAPMIIDTGSPGMVISLKLAEKLGVFRTDEGKVWITAGGIGGSVPAIRTIIDKVQVGGASDRFIPTTVTRSISAAFEGLIGMDFMAKYSMTVDHKKGVLVFEEMSPDPNSPGGRDEQWWRSTFKEFTFYHDSLVRYGEYIDKYIRDNNLEINSEARIKAEKLKSLVDDQYTEADRLLSKLERYANENSVPSRWR